MKKVLAGMMLSAGLLVLPACTYAGVPQSPSPAVSPADAAANPAGTSSAATITEAQAREIALKHAGLSEQDVTFIAAHGDYDDGRSVFDVEFYKGAEEYDYEIDAITGDIISFDFDIEGYAMGDGLQQGLPAADAAVHIPPIPEFSAPQAPADVAVTQDEAKKIALDAAQVAESDTTYLVAGFEYDDGFAVYQVSFVVDTMEYDFEIDANSGAILEYDVDSIYD